MGLYRAVKNEHLPVNAFGWEIDPVGFRTTMRRLWDRYQLPLIITENGLGALDELVDGRVRDDYRIEFLKLHLEQIRLAISDGVDVFGYCPWTAIDVISTHQGISKRYGFIYVDRTEDDLKELAGYGRTASSGTRTSSPPAVSHCPSEDGPAVRAPVVRGILPRTTP
ncbi:aryl-phospho-beta-D-glucosidase BglC [Arthrobacter sp. Hiyo8]|nr:aryl-phospho-beta-D-glucosidase BglC [Arthrobacter sp. Hiyo8]